MPKALESSVENSIEDLRSIYTAAPPNTNYILPAHSENATEQRRVFLCRAELRNKKMEDQSSIVLILRST
ncbi:hypothetical protein N7462_010001 [Penicillium macrosclerotiorum]|uniref:uncharacterized protein n=1 Tax=Penicillium macrosclerotiorum TaxID=303699 RepID=UPI00254977EC|nr:uncharacterized protein N7462_010001 [Penicillium macrosclerotiorum]KAJ5668931.1 hypothetical protein N7462_010001 [Penicillium macrosclerotiorum]